jgi:hypothetical protein
MLIEKSTRKVGRILIESRKFDITHFIIKLSKRVLIVYNLLFYRLTAKETMIRT